MKQFTTTLCAVLLIAACSVPASAQKASLFKNYPDVIELSAVQLNQFFSTKKGQSNLLALPGGLSLDGTVISSDFKYSNLQRMAMKLPAFGNILFALYRRTEADNSVVYTGHLFSSNYADGYELKKVSADKYQLVKVQMEEMLPACNQ
ncbi:MAG TPA: hypothetical protein PKC39_07615 [Ferruginibacter sp.]|nr:hypothetical protein [Ferruginibacter sp.]HMP20811.1 hypothetical protein [Ferruginibacter sp.]